MWKTNMHLCTLTLAWTPPLGQSGASGLPPPPWCSKQSCSEPKTSAPALPWSPPGKHRNLRGCCRGEVIHLLRAKESAKYNPSQWLVTLTATVFTAQLILAGFQPKESVKSVTILPGHCTSQTTSLLADIICHIHSYTFSWKAQGLQCSTAFAKSAS